MPSLLDLTAMFMLGLLGAGHCIGMCGPLVLAVTARDNRWRAHFAYHLGRGLTYTALGAVVGALGSGLFALSGGSDLDRLARLQAMVSLFAALLLVLFALVRLGLIREPEWATAPLSGGIPGTKIIQQRAIQQNGARRFIGLGMFFGLIPCGLSYAALARALPAASPASGALFLAAFALGTFPGLLLLGGSIGQLWRKHRQLSDLLSGVIMLAMALSLAVDALSTVF
ncbi:MAG: sulfite exporter TauE/SafE family protein [Myxococcales bacterium]|nr:MAG: sulfite exporter TauE/SafE family protein [Myxococcales bacterium]